MPKIPQGGSRGLLKGQGERIRLRHRHMSPYPLLPMDITIRAPLFPDHRDLLLNLLKWLHQLRRIATRSSQVHQHKGRPVPVRRTEQ